MVFAVFILASCGDDKVKPVQKSGPWERVSLLLDQGKPGEADLYLDELDPGAIDQAEMLFCRGRISLYEAMASSYLPSDPGLEEAETLFREAVTAGPSHYMARVSLGKTLGLKGGLVEGIKVLEKAYKSHPSRADAYFEEARIYVRCGEIEPAVRSVETGLALEPDRADGYLLHGEILYHFRHQPDEGLKDIRLALRMAPNLPGGADSLVSILMRLASRSMNQRKYDHVLQIVEEVFLFRPDHVPALKLRGQIHDLTGDLEKSLADFQRCLALDPEDMEARELLARAMKKMGYQLLWQKRKEDAMAQFKAALALNAPGVDMAVVQRLLDQHGAAPGEAGFGDEEGMTMEEARSLFEEATALLEAGEGEMAQSLLERYLTILPEDPFAHHQSGLALDLLNREEEAELELKAALVLAEKLDVKLPATYLKLAELAIKSSRFEEASMYLDQHDERFPDQASNMIAVSLRRVLQLREE